MERKIKEELFKEKKWSYLRKEVTKN